MNEISLFLIKIKSTPKKYPRKPGIPNKTPINNETVSRGTLLSINEDIIIYIRELFYE